MCLTETTVFSSFSLTASIRSLLTMLTALTLIIEAAAATAGEAAVENETSGMGPVTEPWLEPCGTRVDRQTDMRVIRRHMRQRSRRDLLRRYRGVEAMATRMTVIAEELVTSYVSNNNCHNHNHICRVRCHSRSFRGAGVHTKSIRQDKNSCLQMSLKTRFRVYTRRRRRRRRRRE